VTAVEFQDAEYGDVVSVAIVDHELAPAAEYWNAAEATPEPASAELEETVTAAPCTLALAAGAVTDPVGGVESFVNVRVVVEEVLPTLSVEAIASVGELVVPVVQAKALVETYGPPLGVEIVSFVCVHPVLVPPSAGNADDAGPEPESATVFVSWKLPPAALR
jgi:hypothetical protein